MILCGALVSCDQSSPEPDAASTSGTGAPAATSATAVPVPEYPPVPARGTALRDRVEELAHTKITPLTPDLDGYPAEAGPLLEVVKLTDPEARVGAVEKLVALGEAVVPGLLARVEDGDRYDYERSSLLEAIGQIGARGAIPSLLKICADDASPLVRSFAALALARIGDDSVLPDLLLRFRYEKDGFVVNALSTAARDLGVVVGVPLLLTYLDGRIRVRQEASALLGEILKDDFKYDAWDPEKKRLENAHAMNAWWWLNGADVLYRENSGLEVSPALERRIIETIFELAQYQMRNVDDARFILKRLGPIAVPYLCRGLVDEEQFVRAHSVEVFERMGTAGRDGVAELRASVGDPLLRASILEVLGILEDGSSYDLLITALEDPGVDARICAIDALGQLGKKEAIPALEAFDRRGVESDEIEIALAFSLALLGKEDRLSVVDEILAARTQEVDVWDLAKRVDRLMKMRARAAGKMPEGYPFDGKPEQKVAFFRASL